MEPLDIAGKDPAPRGVLAHTASPRAVVRSRWDLLRRHALILQLIVGTIFLGITAYALGRAADGFGQAFDALSDASPGWLAGAFVAEVVTYICVGAMIRQLMEPGFPLARRIAWHIGVIIYGFGSLLPGSPGPGFALSAMELKRRGMPLRRTALTLTWCSWYNLRSFLALAALTGGVALIRGRIPEDFFGLVLGGALGLVAVLFLTALIVNRPFLAERVAILIGRFRWRGAAADPDASREIGLRLHAEAMQSLGSQGNRTFVGLMAMLSWLFDAYCLRFALIAVGVHVGMNVVLIAYVAAMLAGTLPLLPGGVGAVEATLPAVLHTYGVPLDLAIAGTLAWRGIALFLPFAVGGLALLLLRLRRIDPSLSLEQVAEP